MAAVVPSVKIADPTVNVGYILTAITELNDKKVDLAVLPELCVTGYTCADLFHQELLLEAAVSGLQKIADATANMHVTVVVGAPLKYEGALYNCSVVISGGKIRMIVPKTYLPDYNEFYEKRWFVSNDRIKGELLGAPFAKHQLGEVNGVKFGVEICEDLWTPIPPSSHLALAGAEVIVNLSASDDLIGKYAYLKSLVCQQSARCLCAYVYSGAGFGESSTDLVFDGRALIAENGTMLGEGRRWQNAPQSVIVDVDIMALRRDRMHLRSFADCCAIENIGRECPVVDCTPENIEKSSSKDISLYRVVSRTPFVPHTDTEIDERCEEILNIQAAGLAQRLNTTGCKTLVVGISGGLDSTLALLVAVRAFDRMGLDRKGIIGITMPGFGTTGRTHANALAMMEGLGITSREICIDKAVMQHFEDIGQDAAVHDVTYENSQARERTQILMDVANKEGGMVLGTGDLSELALGWATYNGDHMSMYGVNVSIPKTLVKYLVRREANISQSEKTAAALRDIIDTPISPELIPADDKGEITQKTEDLVGPYELHDFFLYYTLRFGFNPRRVYVLALNAFEGVYSSDVIKRWMKTFYRRFFSQQFKRSCLPDGPKVGSVCLSPRGDWRMPSDASSALWLSEVESL